MENGDIVLPFSVALVLKKFENFDLKTFKADIKMTVNIRIKFYGLDVLLKKQFNEASENECKRHSYEVYQHVATDLKLRVEEEETFLLNDDRDSEISFIQSKDYTGGPTGIKDMIFFTIKMDEKLEADIDRIVDYPFDYSKFEWRFEMSHFEKKF